MGRIKVLIADDHRDFRRVVHDFLDRLPSVSVVGEAEDGHQAVEQVEKLNPHVVLMDVEMPRMDGFQATKIIKRQWPATKVLITTSFDDPMYRREALEVRADGFILKSTLKPSLEATFGTKNRAEIAAPKFISKV